jgi:multiple sugar transport system permease protein
LFFFLPAVLLTLAVDLYPVLYGMTESVFRTKYAVRVGFYGLGHYARLLRDPVVYNAVRVSLSYVVGSLIVAIPVGMGLALLLNRPWPLRTMFRTVLLIPWVLSQTVTALLWGWLLNPQYGPVSFEIAKLGLPSLDLLGTPATALPTVIAINAWRSFPFAMVLILAALQTVNADVIAAAEVDGASAWQVFIHVTLPLIRTTLLIVSIMLTLNFFNQVTLIYTLTGGSPLGLTETLGVRAFIEAFTNWQLGYAAAFGMVIFVLNMLFSISYIRVLRGSSD